MKQINLTEIDLKVLDIFLNNCSPCRYACAYPEMQGKYPEDCSKCQFTKDVWALKSKLFKEDTAQIDYLSNHNSGIPDIKDMNLDDVVRTQYHAHKNQKEAYKDAKRQYKISRKAFKRSLQ